MSEKRYKVELTGQQIEHTLRAVHRAAVELEHDGAPRSGIKALDVIYVSIAKQQKAIDDRRSKKL